MMINLENVSYKYKDSKYVLKNINLSVKQGEIVAIVGKNGSGKSTIGKLISGIIKLKEGRILIDDIDISKKQNRKIINSKVGIVFQNPDSQIIFNNIKDEFSYITDDINIINDALEYVDMLGYENSDLYYLSLGQKQRIMIAEILARKPKYIVLDEPTTMIDSVGKEKIYNLILKLKKAGYTIICITNLADEILFADKTIILNNGQVVEEIKRNELIEKAQKFEENEIKIPTILEILVKLNAKGIFLDLNEELTIDALINKFILKLNNKGEID